MVSAAILLPLLWWFDASKGRSRRSGTQGGGVERIHGAIHQAIAMAPRVWWCWQIDLRKELWTMAGLGSGRPLG